MEKFEHPLNGQEERKRIHDENYIKVYGEGKKEFDWKEEGYLTPEEEKNWKIIEEFFRKNNGLLDEQGKPLMINDKPVDMKMYSDLKSRYNEVHNGESIIGKDYSLLELAELEKMRNQKKVLRGEN